MTVSSSQRPALKADLLERIGALDRAEALLPSSHPTIDPLIHDLEAITPIPQPLHPDHWPTLLGIWDLIYASQGTVVTRRLPPSVGIRRVWQRLTQSTQARAPIAVENGAVVSLPLVGELTAIAQGIWQPYEDAESASVSFGSITLQSTRLLGISGLHLPALTLPILEALRRDTLWMTSYLDDDLRVGRGVTGNLFIFQRLLDHRPAWGHKAP
ncbi:MAG: PAP/fibrillin family protein [Leptolyngbya sp.]|nr:PAP/fibrillin family protein [Leptolyngbya sp.]